MASEKDINKSRELALRCKTLHNDALRLLSDVSAKLKEQPFSVTRSIVDDLYVASGRIGKALDSIKVDLASNGVFDENL